MSKICKLSFLSKQIPFANACIVVCLQFIVVSLKDGMFNNANVLYKTKFVDGVSTVTRYAQQSSRPPLASNNSNVSGKGKKGKTSKRPRIDTTALDAENFE